MAIRNPRPLAPLSKADSPYQGEMSRRDKRDRASWHGAAVTEGFRTPVVPLIRHGCAVVGSFAALRMRRTPCGCFAHATFSPAGRRLWPF